MIIFPSRTEFSATDVKFCCAGPFFVQKGWRAKKSFRIHIRPNFDFPDDLRLYLGQMSNTGVATGIRFKFSHFDGDKDEALRVAENFCQYANSVYGDTKSLLAPIDCVAFRLDVIAAENWKLPDELKNEFCDHPDQDSHHDCPECGRRVACHELQQIGTALQCSSCLNVPSPELSPKVSQIDMVALTKLEN